MRFAQTPVHFVEGEENFRLQGLIPEFGRQQIVISDFRKQVKTGQGAETVQVEGGFAGEFGAGGGAPVNRIATQQDERDPQFAAGNGFGEGAETLTGGEAQGNDAEATGGRRSGCG
jgi:hypothetical protein